MKNFLGMPYTIFQDFYIKLIASKSFSDFFIQIGTFFGNEKSIYLFYNFFNELRENSS